MHSYSILKAGLTWIFLLTCVNVAFGATPPQNAPAESKTAWQDAYSRTANPSAVPERVPDKDAGAKAEANDDAQDRMSIKKVFLHLPGDQKAIWTSPFRLNRADAAWLVPAGAVTGVLIASDRRNMARQRSNSDAVQLSNNISNAGTIGLAGVPAAMYLLGKMNGSLRFQETGLITGESLINSFIVSQAVGRILGRERPTMTDGSGHFFQTFGNPSFPSNHVILSWTAASVIAHEYPGWLSGTLAYGTAAAVSVSRVTGRNHFPADAIAGATFGWLIGRYTYGAHHDRGLDDLEYGYFDQPSHHFQSEQTGATYVPIDSWIYPAFERLQALGYLPTAIAGLRPWTRAECARLVQQIHGYDPSQDGTSAALIEALEQEFANELQEQRPMEPSAHVEEVYLRAGGVAGQPLADDYHFAKTFVNDFGRPFGTGANAVAGLSTRSVVGPFAFYVRGEYQHAGTLPALPAGAQQAITSFEGLPFAPPQRTGTLDRLRFLDTYVSFNLHRFVVSFGKQALWWGPGADAPFLASNNAEPMMMLRISRESPFILPWIFRWIGPIRLESFWGELGGQQFVAITDAAGARQVVSAPLRPHPVIQGVKFSFKPTVNLEFGFDVSSVFSGPGFPLTLHTLLRSYSPNNTVPGAPGDPGDRRSAFDFSYRLPGLRKWLTLYADSFTEDEFSPISFPRKSSFRAGLYMPRLPWLPQVDLRTEGIYTDIPNLGAPGVEYFNTHYLSGYTNYGEIIGNSIGREGRGINAWSTYRSKALYSVQLHYREQRVNPEFLQGGSLRDFDAHPEVVLAKRMVLGGYLKYEHWNFPLLSTAPKNNRSAILELSFRPSGGLALFRK